MRIQLLIVALSAAVFTLPASAQTPAALMDMKTFSSSADVQALIAKAKADRKDGQPMVLGTILLLPPYKANLEYRPGISPSSVHETEAELMYVIEGSGTIVTGGKLTEGKRTNPENLSGKSIEGGTPQAITKGDFLIVPENTAHQITPKGDSVILMTLHVPRTTAAAK